MEMDATPQARTRRRSPLRVFYDCFSSIRLGIFWISAILVYAAVGSAVPTFRQVFELSEFAYFNHWVFAALIGLFCLTLIVATIRRISINARNLGVLTVHAGLLTLCAGSILYFGRKIEGDVYLEPPRVEIISRERFKQDPARATVGSLPAVKGEVWETSAPMLGGAFRAEVVNVVHSGMRTGSSVTLRLSAPGRDETTVVLEQENAERPHSRFAEFGDRLALMLVPANETGAFYDDFVPALIVQYGPRPEDHEEFELPDLPFYHERFVEYGDEAAPQSPALEVVSTGGERVASARNRPIPLVEHWRMPIPLIDFGSALAADWPITMEIDGYLPYAQVQPVPIAGDGPVEPIVKVRVERAGSAPLENWLMGRLASQSMLALPDGARVEFRWLGEQAEIDPAWKEPVKGRHVLSVRVKEPAIQRDFDVTVGQTIAVDGTGYKLTIKELLSDWPLMTKGFEGAHTPIARVWVETPSQQYERSVLMRYSELNQDRDATGAKMSQTADLVDVNLELSYIDADVDHFLIAAGQSLAPVVIHTAPGGARSMAALEPGGEFSPGDGLKLTLVDFLVRPTFASQPVVIPERQRRSLMDVGRQHSLIRVRLASKDGEWSRHVWVPFSQYNAEVNDGTTPTLVEDVPGVGSFQLIYGRARRRLPTTMALERLATEYYPGREQPREWTSHFRYRDPQTGRAQVGRAFLNNTYTIGDWTFFQASAAQDGKSFTVLGVGNRRGVMTMLLGCTLISLGMIYAFAVKPILVKRRRALLGRPANA